MHIRPAPPTRSWMDATPEKYAYRCLPMSIANAHGWQIFTPAGFWAMWTGGQSSADVQIRTDPDMPPGHAPVSVFGSGTFTIHTHGVFRTPPGWNLYVSGPTNDAKDGATALSAVVETDWAPMTFTMNWHLTRPGHWVRFEPGEAISQLMPIPRGLVEQWEPEIVPMAGNPDLQQQYTEWSRSRDAFHATVAQRPPRTQAEQWQKDYFRGVDMNGKEAEGHQTKLRLCPFARH
jgi:hypothetical protein